MLDLDALIEEAAIHGEIQAGTPSQYLAMNGDARMVAVLGAAPNLERQNAVEWTEEEDRFVLDNMRWMSDAEIGQKLGRSAHAVKIHRFRHLRYDARRKDPEWPNLQAVARIMGVSCQKTVAMWVNQGIIAARVLPTTKGELRAIARTTLYRWATNPENWIYFDPVRITDPHLHRLIVLRRARWDDEWWTPGQAGAYHGVTSEGINNRILAGTLPAKRWGNWWIKRSDAVALTIVPRGEMRRVEPVAEDAFFVLAWGLGYPRTQIARLARRSHSWPDYRIEVLQRAGMVEAVIARYGLKAHYCPATNGLFVDWRDYATRFPRLATAIARFGQDCPRAGDLPYVMYTLSTWMAWHAQEDAQREAARKLRKGQPTVTALRRAWATLQGQGVEPFGESR